MENFKKAGAFLSVSKKKVLSALVFGAVVLTGLDGVFTIDEGYRGVLLRMGKVNGVVDSGLHFKVPLVDKVERISTRNTAFTMATSAYTRDQQTASLKLSLRYQVPHGNVGELYSKYKTIPDMESKLLARVLTSQIKNVVGQYAAQNAVQNREELIFKIQSNMENVLKDEPVELLGFQLEDIEFSKSYEDSIEARMRAEVDVETKRQVLEKERIDAEIVKVQAEAKAKAEFIRAEAEAKAILETGRASAKVIEERANALGKNPSIIQLMAVERWQGYLPTAMLPNSSLPFLNILPNEVQGKKD